MRLDMECTRGGMVIDRLRELGCDTPAILSHLVTWLAGAGLAFDIPPDLLAEMNRARTLEVAARLELEKGN